MRAVNLKKPLICDRYNRMFAAKEAAKQELLRTKGDVSAARSLYVLGLHHKQRVCSLNVMDILESEAKYFCSRRSNNQ